ncbi:MAG: hypothetical protein RL014_2532 [Pseudomonadota bacterium]|jgi:UDP-N-acetylmuramoyl-tripeptide--D-alanyl-D-alanine ligase
MMHLGDLFDALPGAALHGPADTVVQRVHSDTRTLQPGDLFVAIRGERFDANDFIADAQRAGAVAALAHRGRLPAGCAGIEVDDTRVALMQMAAAWRRRFALPLIAVTGSNGKTTVTQMIASILRAWQGDAALATQGNLNNDIGVPLMALRLRAAHRVAVLELGMNHPGEIAQLAAIAQPTVALVNNAQREHQEFMHTVEAVARENGAVLQALPADGVAVFPAADAFTALWRSLAGVRRVVTFGETQGDVTLRSAHWQGDAWAARIATPAGEFDARLSIAGRHNVVNALAATACAQAAGVPLEAMARGLSAFAPVTGRSRALSLDCAGHRITLIDDSYNANPDSVRAAIDVLSALPAPQLLVLGDMGEVGTQGPQFHAEVGAYARERGIPLLFTLGEQSAAMGGRHFADIGALQSAVLGALPQQASVLVKGSRFMKMERVVQSVVEHCGAAVTATATKEASHAA